MTNFLLFLSDLFHQVLFYFGSIFALISLLIEKFYRPIPKKIVLAAAMLCLSIASYQSWLDEHRNTQAVIEQRSSDVSRLNSCLQDARVTQAFLKGLQGTNASQQATINNQQLSSGKQQDAINSCVISLGKMNPIVRREVRVIVIPIGIKSAKSDVAVGEFAPYKQYLSELIITTNEDAVKPSGYLRCDKPFQVVGAAQLPPVASFEMISTSLPTKISDREYQILISNSGSYWGPSTPIYMPVSSSDEHLMGCRFSPQ